MSDPIFAVIAELGEDNRHVTGKYFAEDCDFGLDGKPQITVPVYYYGDQLQYRAIVERRGRQLVAVHRLDRRTQADRMVKHNLRKMRLVPAMKLPAPPPRNAPPLGAVPDLFFPPGDEINEFKIACLVYTSSPGQRLPELQQTRLV